MSRFNFGIVEWALKARGEELCRIISDVGLTCFQVSVGVETLTGGGIADEKLVQEYLNASAKYGLNITCVVPTALDYYSFCRPETQEEDETARRIINLTIDTAEKLGCKYFLLPSLNRGSIVDGPSFHRAVRDIKDYCRRAADKGIMTLFESTLSVQKTIDVMEAVDHPMFKLFFDSQNPYLFDGTFAAGWYRALADEIMEIHVKDGRGADLSGALLGQGDSGFKKCAAAILESGFTGNIMLENYYQDPPLYYEGDFMDLLRKDVAIMKETFTE